MEFLTGSKLSNFLEFFSEFSILIFISELINRFLPSKSYSVKFAGSPVDSHNLSIPKESCPPLCSLLFFLIANFIYALSIFSLTFSISSSYSSITINTSTPGYSYKTFSLIFFINSLASIVVGNIYKLLPPPLYIRLSAYVGFTLLGISSIISSIIIEAPLFSFSLLLENIYCCFFDTSHKTNAPINLFSFTN